MSDAAALTYLRQQGWVSQTPRTETSWLLSGPRVHVGRPDTSDEENWVAYWNPQREALRIAIPSSEGRWVSIAQGFARDAEGKPMTASALTMPSGMLDAAHVPLNSVLFHEDGIYIALLRESRVGWWRLGPRDDAANSAGLRDVAAPKAPPANQPAPVAAVPESRTLQGTAPITVSAQGGGDLSGDRTITYGGDLSGTYDNLKVAAVDNKEAAMGEATKSAGLSEKAGSVGEWVKERVVTPVAAESADAAWRGSAVIAARSARDFILTGLKKTVKNRAMVGMISRVLNTVYGEAAVGYALGVVLEVKATATDRKRKRLARELRVGAEATAGVEVVEPLRKFLTDGIDTLLNVLPDLDALPDPVALTPGAEPGPAVNFGEVATPAAVPVGGRSDR